MGVGFVQQNDRAGIGIHVGENQERLLQTPAARREVENAEPRSRYAIVTSPRSST